MSVTEERAPIPFSSDLDVLPDKNGTPVHAGDWIRDDEGRLALVEKVVPVEGYTGEGLTKNGEVELHFSRFEVRWHGTHRDLTESYVLRGMETLNIRGDATGGQTIEKAERVEMDEAALLRLQIDLDDMELTALDKALAILEGRRRGAETNRAQKVARLEKL